MTRLEHLSQFSNAVLSPELNTCVIPMDKPSKPRQAKFVSKWNITKSDMRFRKEWCKEQIALIGEFGAVMEIMA